MTYEEIADLVVSYANGFERAVQETGLSEDVLKDKLLDMNVEECPDCGWYADSSEMLNNDDEIDGHCENCR